MMIFLVKSFLNSARIAILVLFFPKSRPSRKCRQLRLLFKLGKHAKGNTAFDRYIVILEFCSHVHSRNTSKVFLLIFDYYSLSESVFSSVTVSKVDDEVCNHERTKQCYRLLSHPIECSFWIPTRNVRVTESLTYFCFQIMKTRASWLLILEYLYFRRRI